VIHLGAAKQGAAGGRRADQGRATLGRVERSHGSATLDDA
jgi:hypothetical protein